MEVTRKSRIFARRKAALGKLKASFLCARLHFLCRLEQTIFYMKQEIEQKELGMGNFQGYPSLLRQIKHLNWTHNIILLQRVKDLKARYWYMVQCITGHWSKDYLAEAIKLDYYGKHGALANNFDTTLPATEALEVKSLLKDPYIFDMLTFTDQYDERDIEIGLIKHIEKFLVEMGAGFAFMGRQYHIEVSGDDYYIDMLMYNTFMHRYLVIELKATDFMPEYIGKLNFYCSAIDDTLCREGDNKTIGLLLCKTKDRIKAEYALRDIQKPIGVSDYELGQALPKDFRSNLPSIEEIEKGLNEWNQE